MNKRGDLKENKSDLLKVTEWVKVTYQKCLSGIDWINGSD